INATCGDNTSIPCTIKVAKPGKESDDLGEYVNYECFTGVDRNLLKYTSKKQFSGSNTAEQVFEITANVKWKLLGTDENGNLLITTADPIQTKAGADYNLQGKTGYTTGPDELDRISGLFGHGQYADTNKYTYSYDGTNVSTAGRSMKVEDANKIQPYTPSAFATHTFKKEEDGYISYDGEPKTKYKTFNYYDETSKTWKSLAKGESIVMPHSMYSYNIGTTNNGQKMLRYKADGSTYAFYWLASRAVYCNNNGSVDYDMRTVYGGVVYRGNGMYYSTGSYSAGSRGVRPVVSLESGAQLTEKVGDTWNLGK
ncbi:MAG: hypothetical protein IJ777_01650, partial [Clostridia bacterium]|nr:hypothetical protein [Clostridia bacterium]